MYKIDFKNVKKGRDIYFLFLIVGIIFLCILLFSMFDNFNKKTQMDLEVQAYRVEENCNYNSEGEYMCSPIYHYNVDGKNYICKSNISSNVETVTDKTVYYDSKNPENCLANNESSFNVTILFFMLIPLLIIVVAIYNIIKITKRLKKLKYLAEHGKLFKGLRYTLEETGIYVNERKIFAIAVDCTLSTGSTVHLVSDPRYDHKVMDEDGLVDLLIDPNDLNNYYIDFNIE